MGLEDKIDRKLRSIKLPNVAYEFLGEFFGMFVFVFLGVGTNLATHFKDQSTLVSVATGWAVALSAAVIVAAPNSGGHLNPAVTTSLVLIGRFPLKKVIVYWLGQYMGAIVGAGVAWSLWAPNFDSFTDQDYDDTIGLFGTVARADLSNGFGFLNEMMGSFILIFFIMACVQHGGQYEPWNVLKCFPISIMLGIIVLSIGIVFGGNIGYACNPARDLGPRIFQSLAGWGSKPWTAHDYYFWVPTVAAHTGGALAVFMWVLCLGNMHEKGRKPIAVESIKISHSDSQIEV